ncbi:MAG: hypothetical protein LBF41_00870 [Deltaproteobacteria bacterium]|jgi:hypothetical protein|nr:hypothetical protein [Deltaproteobacteria bacterium]
MKSTSTIPGVILATLLLFVARAAAFYDEDADDRVPDSCDGFFDERYSFCDLSLKYRVPVRFAETLFFMSGLESTAVFCGFQTNDKFARAKEKLLVTQNAKELYESFSGVFDESEIPDKKALCSGHYYQFGPNAPPGPDGEDYRLLR